jgi:CRP-like cAMP-binding protein
MKKDPLVRDLPKCDLLALFQPDDRRELASYGEFLVVRPGESVIEIRQPQDSLYFLISGLLVATRPGEEGITSLGTIRPNEWFGEINVFHPHAASAEVRAREESHIWRISRGRLEEYLNAHPAHGCVLLLGAGEVLAGRYRMLSARLGNS